MSGLIALGVGNAVAYTAPSGVCAPGSYSSGVSMQQRSNSWGALPLHAPTLDPWPHALREKRAR
jgi:hypothetical protein